MRRLIPLMILSVCAGAVPAVAQAPRAAPVPRRAPAAPHEKRVAHASRVPNGRILLDARLNEAEWQAAEVQTGFFQQEPDEGQVSVEPSEVRLVYDDHFLYVGGLLRDSQPDKLITNELKRDFQPRDGELFGVVLDTFLDHLSGYGFFVNAMGAKRDTQVAEDGRANNQSWDGVWDVKTATVPEGWIVELRIPFKTLRFPDQHEQHWGLNLVRIVRRTNELSLWSFVPRPFALSKISFGGALEGIAGVRPGRNIRIKPFVTAEANHRASATGTRADGGMDVKAGLGPSLLLDATYRTDFAQVEADEQQINLTRFSLFFPEKREFFLDNANAFQIGPPTAGTDLVPFFSRSIGLSATGNPVPLIGGGRLSGKTGRTQLGLLNIQTADHQAPGQAPIASSNYSAFRMAREFLSNSVGSAFYLGHERNGGGNRVFGTDVRMKFRRRLDLDGMAMRSETTGVGGGTALRGGVTYDSNRTTVGATYTSLDPAFRNELGFIRRPGTDITTARALQRFRPKKTYRLVREYEPGVSLTRYARDPIGVETQLVSPTIGLLFADASASNLTWNITEEALAAPFTIRPGFVIPVGRYRFGTGTADATMARSHRVAVNGAYRFGEFWNGHRQGFTLGARMRTNEKLATTVNYSRDVVRLPAGQFETNLLSLRVDGSFSTRMFLNAFIQYNSVTREVLSNIRFNLIHHQLSDLFIVYNDAHGTASNPTRSRALIVKFTQLFAF